MSCAASSSSPSDLIMCFSVIREASTWVKLQVGLGIETGMGMGMTLKGGGDRKHMESMYRHVSAKSCRAWYSWVCCKSCHVQYSQCSEAHPFNNLSRASHHWLYYYYCT
jgi:hypothetical protein